MFFNHKIIIILIVIFLCLFLKTKFTETFKIKDSKAQFSFMNVNGLITRVIVS